MKNTGKRGGKAAGGSGRKDAGPGRAGGDAARTKKTPGKPAASRKLPPWMPEPPPRAGGRPPAPAGTAHQAAPRKRHHDPHAAREAERYANPIASREAILAALEDAGGPQTAEELAQTLGLTAEDRFDALGKRLGAMVRDGQLVQNRRGGFAPVEHTNLISGTVIANPNGFGFLRPDAGGGDDLFLPPYEMRKAMHGDRVLANVTGIDRSGRREGSIARVLERGISRLIGSFGTEAGISFVVPDDKRLQRNIQVPPDATGGAREGQLVVCELTQPPDARRPPIGRVIAVLTDRLSQIPGSGWTTPNPVSPPSPTHPDQIATNAGSASSSTGHVRTGRTGFGASLVGVVVMLEPGCPSRSTGVNVSGTVSTTGGVGSAAIPTGGTGSATGTDSVSTGSAEACGGGVKSTLKKGGSVSLVGFGTFSVTKRAARTGRNPRTGASIKIKAAKVPKFRAGKALKDAL